MSGPGWAASPVTLGPVSSVTSRWSAAKRSPVPSTPPQGAPTACGESRRYGGAAAGPCRPGGDDGADGGAASGRVSRTFVPPHRRPRAPVPPHPGGGRWAAGCRLPAAGCRPNGTGTVLASVMPRSFTPLRAHRSRDGWVVGGGGKPPAGEARGATGRRRSQGAEGGTGVLEEGGAVVVGVRGAQEGGEPVGRAVTSPAMEVISAQVASAASS